MFKPLHEETFLRESAGLVAIEGVCRRIPGARILRVRYTAYHAIVLTARPIPANGHQQASETRPANQPHFHSR